MNVLITGANRGLGLGFVRHYLQAGYDVWACHRGHPGVLAAMPLQRVHLLEWDVGTDATPLGALPETLDLLINCAVHCCPVKH